ncbi:MAG: Fic family protein [Dehalococcoidia bacterium]
MNLRLQHSPSGRVVRVGQRESAYWAFVPHPLPPQMEITIELVRVLSDADRAIGELNGLGHRLPSPHILISPFIRKEAVLSSRIEGTQASIANLYAYEAGQASLPITEPAAPESDVHEVQNYVLALEYGLERLATLPVSRRLMRELHERLMTGVRGNSATPGEFRRSQNWIGTPGYTLDGALYVPPPVDEMETSLNAFEQYLHADDTYPPLVRLAFIHYQFEAIHPFLDGNGRIGRLLIILLLVHWDLLRQPLLYLSGYFEQHRQMYYDLLLGVTERGNWREWVEFFLRGVVEQAHDAAQRVIRLQDLQADWHRRLDRARSSALTLRLADSLFGSPFLTVPIAQRMLSVTYRGAHGIVQRLLEASILKPVNGASYGRWFVAQEILTAIEA